MASSISNLVTLHPSKEGRGDLLATLVTKEQRNKAVLLASSDGDEKLIHEAGIWIPSTKEWIITSNRLQGESGNPHVIISAISGTGTLRQLTDLSSSIPMANGGTADGKGGAYLCSQGNNEVGGAIYHTPDGAMASAIVSQDSVLKGGNKGVMLNSPNDIVVYQKKWLLFTDPSYGYEQGFRTAPQNGEFVWCASSDGQVVAPLITTGLTKPNGICLSPDQRTLYVTDTGYIAGNGKVDPDLPRHVLAYDIALDNETTEGLPVKLSNRRVLIELLWKQEGIPDGIKVDVDGNIYVGASDGARIFSSDGVEIGMIGLAGGCSNLCFGGDDLCNLLLLNETRAILISMRRPGVNLQPDYK